MAVKRTMTPEDFLKKWSLSSPVYEGLSADHPGSPLDDLTALLAAERARAREEQREADVAAVLAPAREKDPGLDRDHPEEVHAARVRRAALAATPLADRIVELERERDEARAKAERQLLENQSGQRQLERVASLEREHVRWLTESAEWKARAEKAEAERDEARAEAARLADLHRRCEAYDDQSGPSCVVLRVRAEKAEAERDEARAELRDVLAILEGDGPAMEVLIALAERGTAKKIRSILNATPMESRKEQAQCCKETREQLEEYVQIVDSTLEALGPMNQQDRKEQWDCDATTALRVKALKERHDSLRKKLTAAVDALLEQAGDTPGPNTKRCWCNEPDCHCRNRTWCIQARAVMAQVTKTQEGWE